MSDSLRSARRAFRVIAAMLAALASAAVPSAAQTAPRARVIMDNDFSGDPDGLFALAHLLLSPSVAVPLIVGSHIHPNDGLDGSDTQADNAEAEVRALLSLMGLPADPRVVAGRNAAPESFADAEPDETARAIVAEALRDDDRPLYYAAGAGLTELALALKLEPEIASRMTMIWIGGREHADLSRLAPPMDDTEYNITIDRQAAEFIFNETDIEIWQIPRDVYRQLIVSLAELRVGLDQAGALGPFLGDRLRDLGVGVTPSMGEAYVLGDSPLVTLTALTTTWQPDSASSAYALRPTPTLLPDGHYRPDPDGRPMRVYRTIDTRLTFADMYAKFAAFGRETAGER